MRTEHAPNTIYLKDYQAPDFAIESLALNFNLHEHETLVTATAQYVRTHHNNSDLVLNGELLKLISVSVNGQALEPSQYAVDSETLSIPNLPAQFELVIVTQIDPKNNKALEGLYQSSGNFCTQCEAQGFRKITYYLDRPDVMTVFTTRLEADQAKYPVLLSNGNLIEQGQLANGRHFAVWHDPFRKPSYLFALVAGNLQHVKDTFTTSSGRNVDLYIYTEAHNIDKCGHAMASLKRAMRWDEERFGLEYDLDIYMIVAVDDFNMGAMENKGLNVFNSKLVFASPETATDADYLDIEAVIGHEYFHNWTGNRVTCRDWFQLSLKEGLTVFRDQEFTSDLHSRPVKRIEDVRGLRTFQFTEDASPMAHPIRPASYMEINNFYTMTVYEKGAEVVRMYLTLLGRDGFRKGMDLYFKRHDGQAVTTEDFLAAMADANGVNLSQFQRWYDQAGTPEVQSSMDYDAAAQTCTLTFKQSCPPTPESATKQPYLIPLEVGLLDSQGNDLALQLQGESEAKASTRVLHFTEAEQSFTFINITEKPLPSLLRGFSAPVKLSYPYSGEELAFLMQHDSDAFNRWDAGQRLAMQTFKELLDAKHHGLPFGLEHYMVHAFQTLLTDPALDDAFKAEALALPSETDIAEAVRPSDPQAIHEVREFVVTNLAKALRLDLEQVYQERNTATAYEIDSSSVGRRSLKNVALSYLGRIQDEAIVELVAAQYREANNMTDTLAALAVLNDIEGEAREQAIADFYERWKHNTLVLDKWFALQATSALPDTLKRVEALLNHEKFDIRNPNKVRALIGAFAMRNPLHFHAFDGQGYEFLAKRVLELNTFNPQIASRMVRPLMNWRHYEPVRSGLMKAQLERIQKTPNLSSDVNEIVTKSLV
ncbi:MAG: aminopeptidase N [Thiofilum sp.]|uniref:aminopeptidase N n=1 Tax=Thiofilum sp. TaxID=2212733 RepID=UPI0025CDCCD8|nr:aminopeptidase N [Thiofilum sp.]MBK8454540.1 aminopeptidase N [Thiofilum sp.]